MKEKKNRAITPPGVKDPRSRDSKRGFSVPKKKKKKEGGMKEEEPSRWGSLRRKKRPRSPKENHIKKVSKLKKRERTPSSESSSDSPGRKKVVRNLAKEMMTSVAGRTKFKNFSWREFVEAATLFVESGFESWKQISLLDEETRKFLRGI